MEAYKATMINCSEKAKKVAVEIAKNNSALKTGKITTEEAASANSKLVGSFGEINIKSKAAELAIKGFTLAANMAVMAVAGFVVSKAIEWWDNYTHRVERAKEALDESISSFENTQKEIKNLEDSLSSVNDKINSINSLGGANVTRNGELEKLQSQHDLLEANLVIMKEQLRVSAEQAADDAENLYNKTVENPYNKTILSGVDVSEAATVTVKTSQEAAVRDAIAAYKEYDDNLTSIVSDILSLEEELSSLKPTATNYKENKKQLTDQLADLKTQKESYETLRDDAKTFATENIVNAQNILNSDQKIIDSGFELTGSRKNVYNNVKSLIDDYVAFINDITIKEQTLPESDTSNVDKSLEEAIQHLIDARKNLADEFQKLEDWDLGDYADQIKNKTVQTVFGNVDMDKRTIIHWSDELKQTYRDALDSWDYDPDIGSIDTVFGSSDRFGENLDGKGWEVAFTPILPDGTFLSADTVYDYIEQIVEEAYEKDGKVTDSSLKEIDSQGRQIGNTFVKGIYAGVDDSLNYDNNGNMADVTGRLMHFSGVGGAVQIAQGEIAQAKKQIRDLTNFDIGSDSNSKAIDDFQSKMSTLKTALENIKNLKFSNSDLTDLQQQFPELTKSSGDLEDAIKKLIDNSLSKLITNLENGGANEGLLNQMVAIADEAKGLASTDWLGTFSMFDDADSKLQSLASLVVDLGKSYSLTATEARKYAEIFPDLLAQGQVTANGLIQFNSDVVNDYVSGQQATVAADTEAQITKLENEKSVLEAKKAAAEAAIAIINGQITAENDGSAKIAEIKRNLAQYLINLGVEEQTANATALELMAGNVSSYDSVVADVAGSVDNNLSGAIEEAGTNVANQANMMIDNLFKVGKQANNTGDAIASIGKDQIDAVKKDAANTLSSIYSFTTTKADAKFIKGQAATISASYLSDVVADLKLEAENYTKGIETIDSQIALLRSRGNRSFDEYLKDAKDKADKGKKDKTDEKDTYFDWIKEKIDAIRESYESLLAEFNDSDNAYSTQLNFLDAAIEKQKQLIDTEKLAINEYSKEWDDASKGLSDDIKSKIMFGEIDIDKYKGNDKLVDQINNAKSKWADLSEIQKQYITDLKTLEDNEKSRYTKSIEWKQSEIDDLKEKADIEQTSYEKNIDLMNQAVKKSEELVAAEKQHAEETKSAWEEVRDQLKPEDVAALMDGKADFEQYAEIDPAYYELLKKGDLLHSEYLKSNKKLQESELNLEETRKQAYEKGIEYIEKQIDYISGLNDKASAEKDLIESMGGIVTEGMYRDMISNSKDMMDLYESEIENIKDRMSDLEPDSSEYYELLGNLQSCETALINCQKNQAEWNEAIIRLPIERIQKYLNELANIKQDLNNFLSQKSSVGIATNKDQYQQLISIDQAQIEKYTEQQKKLQNLLKNYKYGSEKFNETSSEIQEIDNAISDLIVEMQDYNYQIARIPVDNLQKVVDTLDNAQTSIENLTAQQDARGIETTIDQYQTMIDLASKRIEVLSTQRQMLVELQSQFEKGSDRYTEIGSEIQDIDNSISSLITNQYEWNKAMLQIPIDRLSNVNDELSSYSSILSDVLSEYDSALSGVTGTLDEQIDKINDLRDATEKEYEEKIKPLQDELDLLEKTNEARSVQIALENAQYELDKARQQKKTQVENDCLLLQ